MIATLVSTDATVARGRRPAAAKRPEVQDTIVYGAGRASPKTFFRHHLAAISSAIARADAQTVLRHATDARALHPRTLRLRTRAT